MLHGSVCVCVCVFVAHCVCVFCWFEQEAQLRVMRTWGLLEAPLSVCSFYSTKARSRWLPPSLLVHPVDLGHLCFFLPHATQHACVRVCVCEVLRSSHGLIEMTFLLFRLNYSAPLFICSPVFFVPRPTTDSLLSGPKTCAHRSADHKNREAITCVFLWGLCKLVGPHPEKKDLLKVRRWCWEGSFGCNQRSEAIFQLLY